MKLRLSYGLSVRSYSVERSLKARSVGKVKSAMHEHTCQVVQALRRALIPSAGRGSHAELPAAVTAPGPHVAALGQGQRVEVTRRQSCHRVGQVHLLRHLPSQAVTVRAGHWVGMGMTSEDGIRVRALLMVVVRIRRESIAEISI